MKEFIFEVERRVYGWMKDRLSIEAETPEGPKEYSREQAFNIIREWAKEFTEKYGNYDFDGSYYDEIDEFIDKKLGTI